MASDEKQKIRYDNVNGVQEQDILSVYKTLEVTLNSKTSRFGDRVVALVKVWCLVSKCNLIDLGDVNRLVDWLKYHTLNIVLTAPWKSFKDVYEEQLLNAVKQCENVNALLSLRCKQLAEAIRDPWGGFLSTYLNGPIEEITEEAINYFASETGYFISTRLRILCESGCEDMAYNLVSAYMMYLQYADDKKIAVNASQDQKRFLLDVYISLLFKFGKISKISERLKLLPVDEGQKLIHRFSNKRVHICKVWKGCKRIAHIAAQIYIADEIMKNREESLAIISDLIKLWVRVGKSEDDMHMLTVGIKNIVKMSANSEYIYLFCDAIHHKFGETMKKFTVGLYIRALTIDMNDRESQKYENDTVKHQETSNRLADSFLKLADILDDHLKISRECVLTAFSIRPTPQTLERLVALAKRSDYTILDTGQTLGCALHPPVDEMDEVTWICEQCGNHQSELSLKPVPDNSGPLTEAINELQLEFTDELRDDFIVVLCSPREQFLSWLLNWRELHRLCVMLCHDEKRTRNLCEKLNFLHIDYSQYMHVKEEPFDEEVDTGIQKGYEHHLLEDNSDFEYEVPVQKKEKERKGISKKGVARKGKYSEKSESSSVEEDMPETSDPDSQFFGVTMQSEIPPLHPLFTKALRLDLPMGPSDPNTVKSLRLFRPNTKRSQTIHDAVPPQKALRTELPTEPVTILGSNGISFLGHSSVEQTNLSYQSYSHMPSNITHLRNNVEPSTSGTLNGADFFKPIKLTYIKNRNNSRPSTNLTTPETTTVSCKSNLRNDCSSAVSPSISHAHDTFPLNLTTKGSYSQPSTSLSPLVKNSFPSTHVSDQSTANHNKILENVNSPSDNGATLLNFHSRGSASSNERNSSLSVRGSNSPPSPSSFSRYSTKSNNEATSRQSSSGGNISANVPFYKPLQQDVERRSKNEIEDTERLSFLDAAGPEARELSNEDVQMPIAQNITINSSGLANDSQTGLCCSRGSVVKDHRVASGDLPKLVAFSRIPDARTLSKSGDSVTVFSNSVDAVKLKVTSGDDASSNKAIAQVKEEATTNDTNRQTKAMDHISLEGTKPVAIKENNTEKVNGDAMRALDLDRFLKKNSAHSLPVSVAIVHPNNLVSKITKTIEIPPLLFKTNASNFNANRTSQEAEKVIKLPSEEVEVINISLSKSKVKNNVQQNQIQRPGVTLTKIGRDKDSCEKDPQQSMDMDDRIQMLKRCRKKLQKQRENKVSISITNSTLASKPLQDSNPKVTLQGEIKNVLAEKKIDKIGKTDKRPGRRTLISDVSSAKNVCSKDDGEISALAGVPGLNDLQMVRPSSVDRIVHVVQMSGARPITSSSTSQMSTPVTPHIQRIGQPESMEVVASTTGSSSEVTVVTTKANSSPVVNVISHQIIRPMQVIKPSGNITGPKGPAAANAEMNNVPRVITAGEQIVGQIISPIRTQATPTLKTIVGTPVTDQNRIVQFICKSSDGKLIPVTSFTSNKVMKVAVTQGLGTNADESLKLVQTVAKVKSEGESPEILPKFQQAFGKPTYENSIDASKVNAIATEAVNSDSSEKPAIVLKAQPKNTTSLNVQSVQGGVIYTRQMPVGQTINLIPPGRSQVFRIATSNSEQLSLVKDGVIHSKMSALLAAALQGKQRVSDGDADSATEEGSPKITLNRPTLVQGTRIVKPVLQIPSNVIRTVPQTNLSSTTLEQLREFDMVYKQVKERSSTTVPMESSPQSDSSESPQHISVTYVNQGQKVNCAPVVVVSTYCSVPQATSPSVSVTSQGNSSPGVAPSLTTNSQRSPVKSPKSKIVKNTTTHASKSSPIPKPQQKPQEDEHTTQRIFDILAEYAEQLRNSPDLNNKPAPRRRSNPPTNPSQTTKRKKGSSKKSGHCSNSAASDGDMEDTRTVGSEDSSCGLIQISVQDEEQTATSTNTADTNESSVSPKQLILSESSPTQSRNLIIADSNVGEALKMSNTAVLVPGNYIMPVSMVKGGQQIAVVSGGSKILATVPARSGPNMLLFQSFLNQTRKHAVPTVKYSTVQTITGVNQSLTGITTQPSVTTSLSSVAQNVTTVTLTRSVPLQKAAERPELNAADGELLLAVAPPKENNHVVPQPLQQSDNRGIVVSNFGVQSVKLGDTVQSTSSVYEKALISTPIATSVIAQTSSVREEDAKEGLPEAEAPAAGQTIVALNFNSANCDKDSAVKVEGRVQSVLVTGTSNGPMLSHSPPTFNKTTDTSASASEQNKEEVLRHEGKQSNSEVKTLQANVYPYQAKTKKLQGSAKGDLQQLSLQRKQAALEREYRLQKSLSEECEDLGVDEPSTSDLFPEADLLFDSNHSPSSDQSSQDLVKRPAQQAVKVQSESKASAIGLFCDDEPMRTDFLFEPIEYQGTTELEYEQAPQDLTNGQNSANSNQSSEDNTLLQTSTTMSDVTIPSPISLDPYGDNSPPPVNKCKFKYTNRKKVERSKQPESWPIEISSSEDTTCSAERKSTSPEDYSSDKHIQNVACEEDLDEYTIVPDIELKDEMDCKSLHCEEAANCPSGRGARRSVKKLCSCCNGSSKAARKRPTSRPHTPFAHKKTVLAKKR